MAQPLPDVDSSEQEILDQLLREGLTDSGGGGEGDDIPRYRKLVTVLFTACILRPLRDIDAAGPSLVALERANLTLSILVRQTAARPHLLLAPSPDQAEQPLYAWLLTRSLLAATRYDEYPVAATLTAALCDAAVRILLVLGRHLTDVDQSGDADHASRHVGPQHVADVVRELVSFARTSTDTADTYSLLGFTDVPTTPNLAPQLFALQIVLQTPAPFINDTQIAAAELLSDLGRRLPHIPLHRATQYANVVAGALRVAPSRHVLSRACLAVVELPDADDEPFQNAVQRLLRAVETRGDSSVRRDVWYALQAQIESLELESPTSRSRAAFLLAPAEPHLSRRSISNLIPEEILQQWLHHAGSGPVGDELRERLRLYIKGVPTSTKRKRDECPREQRAVALLQSKLPDFPRDGSRDLSQALGYILRMPPKDALELLASEPAIMCAIVDCEETHIRGINTSNVFRIWVEGRDKVDDDCQLKSALVIVSHLSAKAVVELNSTFPDVIPIAVKALKLPHRQARRRAGQLVSLLFEGITDYGLKPDRRISIVESLFPLLAKGYGVQETVILLLGDLGRKAPDHVLGCILETLIKQLVGFSNSPLSNLAYTQLLDIAAHRGKQPYTLLVPYMERISVLLAECLVSQPAVVAETMTFIGYNRQTFFQLDTPRTAALSTLVLRQNRAALDELSIIVQIKLGTLLIKEGAAILAKIFLHPHRTSSALGFLTTLLQQHVKNEKNILADVIRLSLVSLIVSIVIELGDEDEAAVQVATRALDAVQRESTTDDSDLGTFLKPHMLGVLLNITEQLAAPRTPTESRRKIVRSIGKLISLVGDSIASFSPQIIASLQSTLEVPELRMQTLETWRMFVEILRYSDVGPFIGPTIAALVAGWSSFTAEERRAASGIIALIAGNASHLQAFRDDIVYFGHIKELVQYCNKLLGYRKSWSTTMYIDKLVDRLENKNLAIATASMRELRDLLSSRKADADIKELTRGDTFDDTIARVVRSLLAAITRDGEGDELRDLSYECFGILGALDPDRCVIAPEDESMSIVSNFTNHDESVTFAIHLIRDLLVGAFRSTNDTKHQKTLAFSIQELLKFCGFDYKLVNRQSSVAQKVRMRWEQLPKDVLETVTPLLDARYQQKDIKVNKFDYPIYPQMKTYREWVQAWTVDLIGRVLSIDADGSDAHTIFKLFNSEPKNQDVAVAHHLLPHLVLHVLLSGDAATRELIRMEIHDVLRDQVSPTPQSAADKRMLSAQVVFDLMDHLSKWLRRARPEHERSRPYRIVDSLITSIDAELAANAALKSRAFARSLRNFEARIVHLRSSDNRTNAELQTYFESLHEIYAELDEPDGMEGVSAFVVSPTLELQIREHESTGRWTSAQSCWEVRLQQSPEDIKLHVGLLKCLKNLGHYDTLRTHIRGVLSRNPKWADELAPFQAEAAWTIGDWDTVRQVRNPPPMAHVFLAIQSGKDVSNALTIARRQIGTGITTREYSRTYEAILQLHMVREVELIYNADMAIAANRGTVSSQNVEACDREMGSKLIANLADRFAIVLPSFHTQEEILNKRRTTFTLVQTPRLRSELGQAWIQSAKIARKAGYEQTAYSAALQANEADAPFAFVQQAKLVHEHGGILKALRELEHPVERLILSDNSDVVDLTTSGDGRKTEDDFRRERNLAKAVLLEARWQHESGRFDQNEVIRRFKNATTLGETLESPFFHLGRYYDTLAASETNMDDIAAYRHFTCLYYHKALERGVKYIYQTMPRLLTVWLDLGDIKDLKKRPQVARYLQAITRLMEKSNGKIQTYQFLTAFPQMVSRITHSNKEVQDTLVRLVYRVIRDYPAQALWPMVGAVNSKRKDRQQVAEIILKRAVNGSNTDLQNRINDAKRLSSVLLRLAEDPPPGNARDASIDQRFPYVRKAFPSTMIMPLQDALTAVLPTSGQYIKHHIAFPQAPVTIIDISDRIEIMPSLQKPKKLVFKGSDGRRYPFLCKPHDDLRKDARLMDFNSMINKFLKSSSEGRRRHLYIRTYAVMPLNEDCGLIEWVSHTNALKSILEKLYFERYKKRVYTSEIANLLDPHKKERQDPAKELVAAFKTKVLPMYRPTVFHEWFLNTWPEPSAWLNSRTNYARTLAVMSMIGYVLGLGDRHGENILFDGTTGDTVHVDLNCLFDKAKTFEIPERVPFRLTHNMVDALGVTGVEGVFRKAAEITMDILRSNGDSLMSVLEAFVHDPLSEWTKGSKAKSEKDVRNSADRNLRPIEKKLRGVSGETVATVPNQVEALIKAATDTGNLGLMYVGWAPWL